MKVSFYLKARRSLRIKEHSEMGSEIVTTTYFGFRKIENIPHFQPQIGWKKRLYLNSRQYGIITDIIMDFGDSADLAILLTCEGLCETEFEFMREAAWTPLQVKFLPHPK